MIFEERIYALFRGYFGCGFYQGEIYAAGGNGMSRYKNQSIFFSIVKIFLYNDISLFSVSYLNLQHYCGSNITII